MNSKITINGTEYTLLAIATINTHDGLLVTMRETPDRKIVQKWVFSDGEFHCVAAEIPFHQFTTDGWDQRRISYAAIHGGAWWEDHSAQLEAMAWIGVHAYSDGPDWIPVQCSREVPNLTVPSYVDLDVMDRTETTAYVKDGKGNEAKYRLDPISGVWEHESDVYGDLENALEATLGSLEAAHKEIGRVLGEQGE